MLSKLSAAWEVMRLGKEVADPATMKNKQQLGNAIGLFIFALVGLAKTFGYDIPIDSEAALVIGGGVAIIWNVVLVYATSKKVGLPAKPEEPAPPRPVDPPAPGDKYFG